ncbi:MAG: single-stranded DNA-binding protein [Candidatus Thermofonsia Clade 1 bacterium]|jgi:single-strand DNA-binding protein|uniref:Single-stranded DNA-binding protein n=1 Tax=Candidatus Thermofonsia Clade 1 bacterium TaxID=2364210 RepID=A0A2M8PYT7_9CHLR|nr:MAG: single-stranded DNA-binding protein [Candidatus Thermofonsia Clade 1 bacterium]PJF42717.1 MAG: single-stranded DNA-binding protein [Candidatus Thermofonsia Clade 1 bacterium]RMF52531.1 MAG: single-stranded DNA-binding protein [Chloroflexota bacterium]
MTYQQLIIVGNVGRDPDFKYTESGIAVCSFSVAVNKVVGRGDQRTEKTTWFRVTFWRERAETVSQIVKKGQRILVVGEVSANAYMAQDGRPTATLEVTASDFRLLSPREDSATETAMASSGSSGLKRPAPSSDDLPEEVGDLPF